MPTTQEDKNAALLKAGEFCFRKGSVALVKKLLSAKTDMNARNEIGETPLMMAITCGAMGDSNVDVVKVLVQAGADVNAKANDGMTALMKASFRRSVDYVTLLIKAGADVNAGDEKGMTALIWASADGGTEVVKLLLHAGADVNAAKKDGETALMRASLNRYPEVARVLLAARADVNAKDTECRTALWYTSTLPVGDSDTKRRQIDVVDVLIKAKADVSAKDKDGLTVLMCASLNGHTETVKALLVAGADVNAESDGQTALMYACLNGHVATVRVLMVAGADVNAKTAKGATALTAARHKGHTEIVKLLEDALARRQSTEAASSSPPSATPASTTGHAVSPQTESRIQRVAKDSPQESATEYRDRLNTLARGHLTQLGHQVGDVGLLGSVTITSQHKVFYFRCVLGNQNCAYFFAQEAMRYVIYDKPEDMPKFEAFLRMGSAEKVAHVRTDFRNLAKYEFPTVKTSEN